MLVLFSSMRLGVVTLMFLLCVVDSGIEKMFEHKDRGQMFYRFDLSCWVSFPISEFHLMELEVKN